MFTLRYNKPWNEVIPDWYGVAYQEPDRRIVVCYLIPLNHVVGVLRNIYWCLKAKRTDSPLQEYRRGYDEGWHENYKVNLSDRQREYHNGYEKGKMESSREIDTLHKRLAELKIAIENLNA